MRLRTSACLLLGTGLAFGAMHHATSTRVMAADSTNTLAIQGRISAANCPVNGDLDLTFEIFASADPTDPAPALFTEDHADVPIRNGHFAVDLGSQAVAPDPGVPASVFGTGGDRWVAIRLTGSSAELVTPRIKLTAVPFAFHALSSAGGGGGIQDINSTSASSFLITAGRGIEVNDRASNDGIEIVSVGVIRVNGVTPNLGDLTLSGGTGVEVTTDPNTGATTFRLKADGSSVVSVNGQSPNGSGDLALSVTGSNGVTAGGTGNTFTVALDPGVVRTLNGRAAVNGDYRIEAGTNVTLAESGNTITINASGGGGGGGVATLNSLSGAVVLQGTATGGVSVAPNGQTLELSLDLTQAVKSFNGTFGAVTLTEGTGISITNPSGSDHVISVKDTEVVTSIEGQRGAVDLVGGGAVSIATLPSGEIEISAPTGGGGGAGVPIGTVVDWYRPDQTTLPPTGWVVCNGQTISDGTSPFNGKVVPDLTGRFVRGAALSAGYGAQVGGVGIPDAGGQDSTNVNHTHTTTGQAVGLSGVFNTTSAGQHQHTSWMGDATGHLVNPPWQTHVGSFWTLGVGGFGPNCSHQVPVHTQPSGAHSHSVSVTLNGSTSGGSTSTANSTAGANLNAIENRPVFVGLVKIIRIK